MANYYTKRKQDVLDAIAGGCRVNSHIQYDDITGQFHLMVTFYPDEDSVTFQGRGYRARSEEEALKKGKAQFTRLTSGKYISRPSLSKRFKEARALLEAKFEKVLKERSGDQIAIKALRIDWNAKAFKFTTIGNGDMGEALKRYEPEFSRFREVFTEEVR